MGINSKAIINLSFNSFYLNLHVRTCNYSKKPNALIETYQKNILQCSLIYKCVFKIIYTQQYLKEGEVGQGREEK
jgi:hypothetical protein